MKSLPVTSRIFALAAVLTLAACSTSPDPGDAADRSLLDTRTQSAIADFKQQDPAINHFFTTAYAYAVFPEIGAGALIVGAAHGEGEVFQGGKLVGYADLNAGSIGAQIGGQRYAEIIFFQGEGPYVDFKDGTLEFDARATAVAASQGAAATADYRRGVLVFTLPQSGLMAQAAIGGQKFRFRAANP